MTDRYAVMGDPVSHSRSPAIHKAFARQTGEDLDYEAIPVSAGRFQEALEAFREKGGRGLNITLPFKEEAFRLAHEVTDRGRRAGAVNTLWFDATGGIHGDNTDGLGLVRDLVSNLGCELEGKRLLIVGAGGATRGIIGPLLERYPERIVIANRTESRARDVADVFKDSGPVAGCGLDEVAGNRFDLVINATSASIAGKVPALPGAIFGADGWGYDLMYGREPTAFMKWAERNGAAHVADGLGMLVEQASESFRIWRGVRPDTRPVIRMLRTEVPESDAPNAV